MLRMTLARMILVLLVAGMAVVELASCSSGITYGDGMRIVKEEQVFAYVEITDTCNDGRNIDWRIFEYAKGTGLTVPPGVEPLRTWPEGSGFHTTSGPFEEDDDKVMCRTDYTVCYGAKPSGSGSEGYWGVGIDGTKGCTDCCGICPVYETPIDFHLYATVSIRPNLSCDNS